MVPMAEMFGYATTLRSFTQGRGTFTMEFCCYEPVPADRARTIWARARTIRMADVGVAHDDRALGTVDCAFQNPTRCKHNE